MNLEEKFLVLLDVIADNIRNGGMVEGSGVYIPQLDFLQAGLEKEDIGRLLTAHDRLWAKRHILYQPKETTPSLKIQWREEEGQREGDKVWYDILFFTDPENFLKKIAEIKERIIFWGLPNFDKAKSKIVWGDKECSIRINTLQYYVCATVLNARPGEWVDSEPILSAWDKTGTKDKKRSVYDVVRKLNEQAMECFGVEIFRFSDQHVSLNEGLSEFSTD